MFQVLHKIASAASWNDSMRVIEPILGGGDDDKEQTSAAINCLTFILDWIRALIKHKLEREDFATHIINTGQLTVSEYTEVTFESYILLTYVRLYFGRERLHFIKMISSSMK